MKKKLSGWLKSVIVGGVGVIGIFLGLSVATGIGMMTEINFAMFILMP